MAREIVKVTPGAPGQAPGRRRRSTVEVPAPIEDASCTPMAQETAMVSWCPPIKRCAEMQQLAGRIQRPLDTGIPGPERDHYDRDSRRD